MENRGQVISEGVKAQIIQLIKKGMKPNKIAEAMVQQGFDSNSTYRTVLEIVEQQFWSKNGIVTQSASAEIPTIGEKGYLIHTTDCEITVRMRMDKPLVLLLENLLSYEECDQLIQLAKPRLKPSLVVDQKTGEEKASAGRTSKGMYFVNEENDLLRKTERRIAELTNYPIENGEGTQVLHYEVGEEYKPHYDFFPTNKVDSNKGGQRIGTLLMYLNDVQHGGETTFPYVNLSIAPKKGTGIYFHYTNSQGKVDRLSLHKSNPVIEGEKWVATKWIRQTNIYSSSLSNEKLTTNI